MNWTAVSTEKREKSREEEKSQTLLHEVILFTELRKKTEI